MLGTPLGQGFFQADRPEQRQATDSLNISTTSIRERQQSGVPSMFAFWSRREYGYTGVEGDLILQAGTEASMLGGYTREPNTTALRLCFLPRPEVSKTGVLITFFSERRLLAEPRIPPILTPFSVVESVLSRKLARYERRLEYSFAIADGELAVSTPPNSMPRYPHILTKPSFPDAVVSRSLRVCVSL